VIFHSYRIEDGFIGICQDINVDEHVFYLRDVLVYLEKDLIGY